MAEIAIEAGKGECQNCGEQRQFDTVEPQSLAIGWKDYSTMLNIRLAELQVWNNVQAEEGAGFKPARAWSRR